MAWYQKVAELVFSKSIQLLMRETVIAIHVVMHYSYMIVSLLKAAVISCEQCNFACTVQL